MTSLPKPERRQFGRRQSALRGMIQFGRRNRCACTVQNFSEAGALIILDDAHSLPDTFDLTIDRTGLQVWCSVKHRNGTSFGVQFCQKVSQQDTMGTYRSDRLTYDQLLALATADREGDEFSNRYGQRLATGSLRPLNTNS